MAEHLALYRKYRPSVFADVVGQDHIIKVLQGQIKTGKMSHAYLLSGTRGTGKTTTARIFAKAVNCLTPKNGEPCGKCEACKVFGATTDIIEIDAASNNKVDEIRELRENIRFAPMSLKYKVYIIDEVHMLTDSAFNALLKTLEEPPAHAIFILGTTEPQKLPATILSRCIKFNFRLISTEILEKYLSKIFKAEGVECEPEALHLIASLGEGSCRDTLTIADMCASFCENSITYEKAREVLSCIDTNEVLVIAVALIEKNFDKVFKTFHTLLKSGKGSNILARELLTAFKNAFIAKNTKDANKILKLPADLFETTTKIGLGTDNKTLSQIIEILIMFDDGAKTSLISPDVLFEAMLIRILNL